MRFILDEVSGCTLKSTFWSETTLRTQELLSQTCHVGMSYSTVITVGTCLDCVDMEYRDRHPFGCLPSALRKSVIAESTKEMKVSISEWYWLIRDDSPLETEGQISNYFEARKHRNEPSARRFVCPKCSRVSYNPNDIANSYCGNCGFSSVNLKRNDQQMKDDQMIAYIVENYARR